MPRSAPGFSARRVGTRGGTVCVPKVRALAPITAELRLDRDRDSAVPGMLVGLLATVRCLEQAHELLNHARFEGQNHERAEQARQVLHGLSKLRDTFAGKLETHPLYERHFVREELAGPGIERLRALGVAH